MIMLSSLGAFLNDYYVGTSISSSGVKYEPHVGLRYGHQEFVNPTLTISIFWISCERHVIYSEYHVGLLYGQEELNLSPTFRIWIVSSECLYEFHVEDVQIISILM